MIGAIAGDVIGSAYEVCPTKSTAFPLFDRSCRFTDDTVLTVATAWALLRGKSFDEAYYDFGRRYPHAGYGEWFHFWLLSPKRRPYNSFGNGSAMRVSPVGFAFATRDEVLSKAAESAVVTHNHAEGVKGAQAIALAVFMARTGASKDDIREELSSRFGYDLERTVDGIRPGYSFDVTCQGSVPEAVIAFLESTSVEHAIRLAVSLGGDSDTLGAMTGSVAHAYYGALPDAIERPVRERLPGEFLEIIDEFQEAFPVRR